MGDTGGHTLKQSDSMPKAPVIETPRLLLRGWRDDDVEPWVRMNADPQVMAYYPSTHTREESEASALTIRTSLERDGYGIWVVEIKGGLPFAGVICLRQISFEAPFAPANDIGWCFLVEAWGHGYATEGATAALDFAFEQLNWDEVTANTSILHVRSQRVMQRLGMTHNAADDFDHPKFAKGHRARPHVLYRISRQHA